MSLPEGAQLMQLIESCKKGDRKAQEVIYKALYGKMMSVCYRYTKDGDEAKDILQEGYIKMYANLKKYNGEGSFEGWVRRIMVNTAIDFFRKNKHNVLSIESEYVDEPVAEVDEDNTNLYGVSAKDVMKEVQNLSPAYRAVFSLYIMEGYTHQEIADMLDISVGTSKSNLAKAKMNLKKALSKKKVATAV